MRIIYLFILFFASSMGWAQEIELAVPRNHTEGVTSLSMSFDGKFLITASYDKTIILREVSSGNYLRMYEINNRINDVKFLADNLHFIIQTDSGIFIHDIRQKKSLQTIQGDFSFVRSNRMYNEFTVLNSNGALTLYQETGGRFKYYKTIDTIRTKTKGYFSYSADGQKIIYFKNGGINIYDVATNKAQSVVPSGIPDSSMCSIAIKDDMSMAIGLLDGSVCIYDRKLKTKTTVLRAYTSYWKGVMYKGIVKDSISLKDPVRDLEFIDSKTLISYHSTNSTGHFPDPIFKPSESAFVAPEDLDKMWDDLKRELEHDPDEPLQTKDLWGWQPTLIAWNIDTKKIDHLTSTGDPISISREWVATPQTIINLNSRESRTISGENTKVSDARFSITGRMLVLNKNYVNSILDLTTGVSNTLTQSLKVEHFGNHKNFLGVQTDGGWECDNLGLLDMDSRKIYKTIDSLSGRDYYFNPEKEQIAYGTYDRSVKVIDFNRKKLFSEVDSSLRINAFSLDGGIFLLSDDQRTRFYETDHFTFIDSLPRFNPKGWHEQVHKIQASRNLVYVSMDEGTVVRDIALKQNVDTLKTWNYQSIALSPAGNFLAAGYGGGSITFFDLKKKTSRKIIAHDAIVNALDFSPDGRIMISVGGDGLIKFWDTATQTIVAQLLFYGNDWVAVNQDGLFDGSPGGMAKLFFINGLQTIELNQLKDRFYEPGLLSKVLGINKEQLRKSQGLRNIQMFPKIDVSLPDEKGVLTANISNQGGGIGRVKIFINGKEAMADARGAASSSSKDKITVSLSLPGHPFLKPNEVNVIEVKAFNEDEYLESPAKKVYYLAPGESQASINLFAVVMGTSDYNGTQLDLRYAAKDAEQFGFALSETSTKLFGKEHVHIELMTTGTKEKWPTKSNIKKAFVNFSKQAKPNDILIVYLAGHGLNYGSEESDFYYLTAEAQSGNLQDPVVRGEVAISSHEFTEYIKMVPALKQIMILDACHSGKFAEDMLAKREVKSAGEIRALERMKDRTGMYILSGSAADAVSYEASSFGQGLLTYSLLMGIKGAALRDKQYLDVMGLFQYSVDVVPQLAQNIGGIQKPELRVPYAAESFDIGILDEEINRKIILPTPKPVFIRSVFQDEDTFGDPLGLSDQLDEMLKSSPDNSEKTTIIFIDATKYSDGFALRGRYKKTGDLYEVTFKLLKGDKAVKDFHTDGKSAEELTKKIIKLSTESIH